MRLIALMIGLWVPAAWAMSPAKCSMVADAIFVLVRGERIPLPADFHPYILAAGKFYAEAGEKDPYYHSTTFFLECMRTEGDVSKMYDPRFLVNPMKKFQGV